MPYIGNDLQVAFPSYTSIDDISSSFNGVLKTFPLRVSGSAPVPFPINPQQCLISVNNVVQKPDPTGTTGFNLVGTNIVFATAPTAGWNFFGVILAGADYVTAGTKFPTGSASVPSITFEGDTDTGVYNVSPNELGFTTGGVLKSSINSAGQYLALTGSAAAPIYSFSSDSNTGIFSPGADQIGLATAGTARIQFDSNGALGLSGANYGTSGQVLTSNGSGSAPTWQNIATSVTASGNNTFTGANTFQNASGQTFVSALTTHDGININGGGAGSSSYRISVAPNTLTANRAVYFPNQNGDILVAGNASIVNADISATAGIAFSKLASLTSAQILLGDASNVVTATAVTGDITISNTGVTEISAGVIVNADINASAAIAHSKLASITAGSVLIGNVSNVPTATAITGDISIDSSGVTAIGSGVIVNADIDASAAIEGTKIVAGTTSIRGTLQLTDSTSSTSTTTAATPNSVKTAYDLANAAQPKVRSVTAGATTGTLTPNSATTDLFVAEGLTGSITLAAPTGTPTNGQRLMLRFKDNGTARGITWTTSSTGFRALGITLPTTTVAGKVTYVGCVYNTTDSFWDAVASTTQA
jgi:hypothetical protein